MQKHDRLELAYALLPGFGIWAPRGPLRIRLNINQTIDQISVFYESGTPEEYEFPALWFYDESGAEFSRYALVQSAVLSDPPPPLSPPKFWSVKPFFKRRASPPKKEVFDEVLQRVKAAQPIASGVALSPSLCIALNEPTHVATLQLGRHRAEFGERQRHIGVKAYLGKRLVFTALNFTPEALVEAMEAVHRDLAIAIPDRLDEGAIAAHVTAVQNALCAALDAGRIDWPAQRLAFFLPIYEEHPDLTPFCRRVIAEVIVKLMNNNAALGTASLSPLRNILSSQRRLAAVIDQVNGLLCQKNPAAGPVFASKHLIQAPVLVVQRDTYLDILDDAFAALEACEVQPMLAYGSLLGAVREGAFLQHDDDVDILYFDGARSFKEMLARRDSLIEKLSKFGFHRKSAADRANFHMANSRGKVDVFPTWEERGEFFTMRRYPHFRPIPVAVMLPRSEVVLHGRRYPAPARPGEFLTWRYGPDWGKPNPYHEWPWPIAAD